MCVCVSVGGDTVCAGCTLEKVFPDSASQSSYLSVEINSIMIRVNTPMLVHTHWVSNQLQAGTMVVQSTLKEWVHTL